MGILLLAQGELNVGFVSASNTWFATILKKGELFVFPKRLVHIPAQWRWRWRLPLSLRRTRACSQLHELCSHPTSRTRCCRRCSRLTRRWRTASRNSFASEVHTLMAHSCMRQMLWQDDCIIAFNFRLGKIMVWICSKVCSIRLFGQGRIMTVSE